MMHRRVTDLWILSNLNSFRERGCGKLMLSGLDLGLRGLDCFGSMVLSLCRLLETDFKAEEDALQLTEIKGEASMTTESRSLELAGDIYRARSRVTLTRLSAIITVCTVQGSRGGRLVRHIPRGRSFGECVHVCVGSGDLRLREPRIEPLRQRLNIHFCLFRACQSRPYKSSSQANVCQLAWLP